jgi:hypothetical protein
MELILFIVFDYFASEESEFPTNILCYVPNNYLGFMSIIRTKTIIRYR